MDLDVISLQDPDPDLSISTKCEAKVYFSRNFQILSKIQKIIIYYDTYIADAKGKTRKTGSALNKSQILVCLQTCVKLREESRTRSGSELA